MGRGKENTSSQTPTSSHITDQRNILSVVDMVGDTYIPDQGSNLALANSQNASRFHRMRADLSGT